ncbi:hypothetical protein RRG08_021130 [Elysia crispata]|uniref:Secreted protein n=1 Tax=Elysia crispata TaxID=231223 RepID=A0AAE1DAI1_9GAST|nr:hypothetical protein RRG08_021130 [Elysia crispata]
MIRAPLQRFAAFLAFISTGLEGRASGHNLIYAFNRPKNLLPPVPCKWLTGQLSLTTGRGEDSPSNDRTHRAKPRAGPGSLLSLFVLSSLNSTGSEGQIVQLFVAKIDRGIEAELGAVPAVIVGALRHMNFSTYQQLSCLYCGKGADLQKWKGCDFKWMSSHFLRRQ